jgi:serine/threonine protein kinase
MITSNKENYEELSREYDIFIKYKHKNILSILGISKKILDDTTYCMYILMEVAKTDWEKEINERQMKNKFYSEDELINILNQLTSALVYLQKNNISHRDIKAQNILVFENNIYKIADFGEAKQFKRKNDILSTLRGTELYMSPLLFNGLQKRIFDIKHNPFKSDVFSLGMCLLFASTLRIKNLCKIRDCIDDVKLQIYLMKVVSQKYSLKFVKLLNQMLCNREESRPDFYELENILENY